MDAAELLWPITSLFAALAAIAFAILPQFPVFVASKSLIAISTTHTHTCAFTRGNIRYSVRRLTLSLSPSRLAVKQRFVRITTFMHSLL